MIMRVIETCRRDNFASVAAAATTVDGVEAVVCSTWQEDSDTVVDQVYSEISLSSAEGPETDQELFLTLLFFPHSTRRNSNQVRRNTESGTTAAKADCPQQ